ncbi:type I-E CRISPR-associated protein Cse1/CasA (plasmid) [Deinococcus sp. KNUC1210]|uniref:type I-E CRISPR-associated protein Cse1/CasA n=1 Tax=Deinococcus sp. KNUC1210 TaxID=2917691 RepID=UPI001EF0A31A|nr:type I-E CRISPR-associated protein Cse1/CasA [Deinococcus sp. KNUC1210]ULH14072.1 type I-E CRISPR-associated protein Cse1/CasA [Deinococcus sp. KNUC1210]
MERSFSLLIDGFIPVRLRDGSVQDVGLGQALLRARDYERIDHPSPLVTAALYRLCLAVLHRALEGPAGVEEVAGWYRGGFPAGALERYFERFGPRFELFHSRWPFMQVADLHLDLEEGRYVSHWSRLGTELGSANTTALFNPAARPKGDRHDAVTPAEAARRLLEHQTFALGGLIRRFTTSARSAPVATLALTMAQGRSLHETLCLNLVPYCPDGDLPAWEQPPLTVEGVRALYDPVCERRVSGLTDHYSWLSRSVRLQPEMDRDGRTVVRFIGFAAGVPYHSTLEESGETVDPMVATSRSYDPRRPNPYPRRIRRHQLFWRDVLALLPGEEGKKPGQGNPPQVIGHARAVLLGVAALAADRSPREENMAIQRAIPVSVFGQVSDQGKTFAVRQEGYTLPDAYLTNDHAFTGHVDWALRTAQAAGEGLTRAVHRLATELLARRTERAVQSADLARLISPLPAEPTYWSQLEAPFRTYLSRLDDPQQAGAQWQQAVEQSAWRAWDLARGASETADRRSAPGASPAGSWRPP